MMLYMEKYILLQLIDSKWKDHLYSIDNLKEGIQLRAYGQRDPLVEYSHEAFHMFEAMVESIKHDVVEFVFKAEPAAAQSQAQVFEASEQQFLHPEAASASRLVPQPQAQGEEEMFAPSHLPTGALPQTTPEHRAGPKVGRNEPCPCGSGKKYKKCHGS